MFRLAAILGVLIAATALVAIPAADTPKQPPELAMLPRDAMGVITIKVSAIFDHPSFQLLREELSKPDSFIDKQSALESGLTLKQIDRISILVNPGEPNAEPHAHVAITTRTPYDRAAIIRTLGGTENRDKIGSYYQSKRNTAYAFLDDRTICYRIPEYNQKPTNPLTPFREAKATGPLAEVLAIASEHAIVAGLNMNLVRGLFAEDVPAEFALLLRADKAMMHLTLGANSAKATVKLDFAGKKWASDGEEGLKAMQGHAVKEIAVATMRLMGDGGGDKDYIPILEYLAKVVDKSTVQVAGNTATGTIAADLGPAFAKLLAPLPNRIAEEAIRAGDQNNLKQIGLAFHNYESVNGTLPTNILGKDGKPLLSWRVHLLPYIEQDQLYKEFKLDEPWDSDNNKKLIAKMPKTFEMAGIETKEKGQTFFQAFIGKKGDAIRPLMLEGDLKGLPIVAIADGSSNTFMVVEASEPVIWTKPVDLPFDANEKLPKLGRRQPNGFNVVFCDASTRFIKSTTPEATLKAYITTNGGEVIEDN